MAAKLTSQSTSCTNCAFYDDHVGNTAGQPGDDAGLCRFNPPVSQPSPDAYGLWPVVSASDWSGHFSSEGAVGAD